MSGDTAWQLKMFNKSLKKKMRYGVLKKHLGTIGADEKCLLVTCGDNNGAMNHYLRELGGKWSFADLEDTCVAEMSELLGQEVQFLPDDNLGFADASFDRVITIDVHEHLDDCEPFSREVGRIAKPNAQVICTVPNGDEDKIAVKIKNAVGMSPKEYGHSRVGLTIAEMQDILRQSKVEPTVTSTFSRFFTEMLELTINFLYVKVLAKRSKAEVEEGQIAPATKDQIKSVEKTYKMYSLIFPIYWLISRLDALLFFTEGYVVVVEGRRIPA
ncbi:MAG: class I SAM-dependent methyltransferase [Gammaproteobacteria bacterium]|nr:class I SAM-dependent methyltransferase [Gammaproteobacteria bacterium]